MVDLTDPTHGMRVYVSYTSGDEDTVDYLVEALRARGIDAVFRDQPSWSGDGPSTVADGALVDCGAMILIYSANTHRDRARGCLHELEQAVALARPIIPVVVDSPDRDADYAAYLDRRSPIAWGDPKEVVRSIAARLVAPAAIDMEALRAHRAQELCRRTRDLTRRTVDERLYQFSSDRFVQRPHVRDTWSRFLQQHKPTFALVGASGRGKSAALGWLVEQVLEEEDVPCLFYLGGELGDSLLHAVARDLRGGPLGAGSDPQQVVEQALADLSGPLYVFVDSLDSVASTGTVRSDLNLIARYLSAPTDSADPRGGVRLVVSCTDTGWSTWSRVPGKRQLSELAVSTYSETLDGQSEAQAVRLGAFENDELDEALEKYGIDQPLSPQWRQLCRNAEVLTLVAKRLDTDRDAPLPQRASLRLLLEDIVDDYFPDRARRRSAFETLHRMAREMLDTSRPRISLLDGTPWDHDALDDLVLANLVDDREHALRFKSDVIAEQLIGQQLHRMLFDRGIDDEAACERLTDYCSLSLELLPGALIAAFRYSAEVDGDTASHMRFTALLRGLIDMEAKWVVVAALALKDHAGTVEVIEDLIAKVCRSESYAVRATAAQVLSERRGWYALIPSDDWRSREVAALARLNDRECTGQACGDLWRFADDPHWRVRRAAGYGLQRLWSTCGANGGRQRLHAGGQPLTWRQAHGTLIAIAGEPARVEDPVERRYLMDCARSDNRQLRWLVAYYLPRYSPEAFAELLTVLRDETDPWVRATFAQSVVKLAGEIDDGQLGELLDSLCSDPDAAVRVRTARALGTARNELLAGPHLRRMCDDADSRVREAARYALTTYPGLAQVEDEESSLHPAKLVERIALQDTDVPTVERRLYDFSQKRLTITFVDDPYVKSFETMRALLEWSVKSLRGSPQVEELLDLIMADPDEGMRWSLVLCLLDGDTPLSDREVVQCVSALQRDPHMWVRRELATGLPSLARRKVMTSAAARTVLLEMRDQLEQEAPDFVEEVAPFLSESLAQAEKALA